MAGGLKPEQLETYRKNLLGLEARLKGDLDQMSDEAFGTSQSDSSNLSNVPVHLADLGTDNYDQEFTLGLIENEQETLEQIREALGRVDDGTYGQCQQCERMIAPARLQALPYTPFCIECARAMEQQG